MTVALACTATCASCVALACVAYERARSYGLHFSFLRASAIVPAIVAVAAVAMLAAKGDVRPTDPLLLAALAIGTASDAQVGYIFDRVLLVTGVALACVVALDARPGYSLAGAAVAGGTLLIPYVMTRARGIGFGDVKFATVAGFAMGASRALAGTWLACVLAGVWGAVLLLTRRAGRGGEMRFGPFIALGACCALFVP